MNTFCKAVIFDLDGTLLDTIGDLAVSMNYALRCSGFPERELSHHSWAVGNGLRKYIERCLPEDAVSDTLLDEMSDIFSKHYDTHCAINTIPYKGICDVINFLNENNISVNILSNKRDGFVKDLALHYFGDYKLDSVYGELPDVAKKPNPEAALKIAQEINIDPCDILFIGDSIYDIETGKNAGMKTMAVTWGYQPEEKLAEKHPDYIVHTPKEIIKYVRGN